MIIDCLLKPGQLSKDQCAEIVKIADAIIAKYNQSELLEFYGRKKPDDENDEQKEKRKENNDKKKQIINALKNKAMAYAAVSDKETHGDDLEAAVRSLQQWTSDDSSSNLSSLLIKVKRDREAGHPASALKSVQKYISEASFTADTVNDISKAWTVRNELLKELEWSLWAEYDDKWNLIRQPPYGLALF